MKPAELVAQIKEQILVRAGEVVTPELAEERARNIVTALTQELEDAKCWRGEQELRDMRARALERDARLEERHRIARARFSGK